MYGHLDLNIPPVIELEQVPFSHIMLRQIACPAAVDPDRLAGNTEVAKKVFAFLQLLFFQSKHRAGPGKG